MTWLRRPPRVRVSLAETAESRARKRAEADAPRVAAHVAELRYLRDERNELGERFAMAFRLAAARREAP